MQLRFGRISVRLGPAPVEEHNFFSIRCMGSTCVLRAAAFAEDFDSALTFYVELCQAFRLLSPRCWFELERLRKKRLPQAVAKTVSIKGYTQRGAVYGDVLRCHISSLLNEYWISGRFRMFGTQEIPTTAALELAVAFGHKTLRDTDELPNNVLFMAEKHYQHGEPYILVAFENGQLSSVRRAVTDAAAGLKRPLLEVGSSYFVGGPA